MFSWRFVISQCVLAVAVALSCLNMRLLTDFLLWRAWFSGILLPCRSESMSFAVLLSHLSGSARSHWSRVGQCPLDTLRCGPFESQPCMLAPDALVAPYCTSCSLESSLGTSLMSVELAAWTSNYTLFNTLSVDSWLHHHGGPRILLSNGFRACSFEARE